MCKELFCVCVGMEKDNWKLYNKKVQQVKHLFCTFFIYGVIL